MFGSQHPETHERAGNLGRLFYNMNDHAAAAPLLREAVQGFTAVHSADHHLVHDVQGTLDRLAAWQAASAAAEQLAEGPAAEEQQQETMYQRMAKRRRRE